MPSSPEDHDFCSIISIHMSVKMKGFIFSVLQNIVLFPSAYSIAAFVKSSLNFLTKGRVSSLSWF